MAGGGQGAMPGSQLHKINNTEAAGHQGPAGLHLEPVTKRERSPSPSECCSPDTLNPPSPADSSKLKYNILALSFLFLVVAISRSWEVLPAISHKGVKTLDLKYYLSRTEILSIKMNIEYLLDNEVLDNVENCEK